MFELFKKTNGQIIMRFKNYDQEKIRRYLRGEMKEEELKVFEDEVKNDEALKQEVQFQQKVFQDLEVVIKDEGKDKLNKARKQASNQPRVLVAAQPYLNIAALLALVVAVVAGVYWSGSFSNGSDKLFAEHFQPYANTLTSQTRGGTESFNSIDSAMHFYSMGDFETALKYLNNVESGERSSLVEFYKGNACLALERSGKAIEVFSDVQGQLPEKYEVQGKWYLALAYMKEERFSKAKKHLKVIANKENSFYADKAEKILNKL